MKIKKRLFESLPSAFKVYRNIARAGKVLSPQKGLKIGFVVDEFFHEDLRGFGGYGMLVKNLCQEFNNNGEGIKAEVFLSSMIKGRENEVEKYHDTNVYFRSGHTNKYLLNFLKYGLMANQSDVDLLISVDWYQSYEYIADSLPDVPLLVWIQDPRSKTEWQNISTVPLEAEVIGGEYGSIEVDKIFNRKKDSMQRLRRLSKKHNRRVVFATQAKFLVERARKAYGIDDLEAEFLPNVIEIPDIENPQFSKRPSLCLLGRLDPVKRPWIFFELAKKFPQVDFLVAGTTHNKKVMDPIINRYSEVKNLIFLGHVGGSKKRKLLNSMWALVNTSIHEALPVTFLEAFAYGKPVISCQNPDNLVSDYGYWTGEILGEGLGAQAIDKLSYCLSQCIKDNGSRIYKGMSGHDYVRNNHSLSKFKEILNALSKEK